MTRQAPVIYQRWLAERWCKGRLTLDDVRALKICAQVLSMTAEEQQVAAAAVGADNAQITDENNMQLNEWLRWRQQTLPPSTGSLKYASSEPASIWTSKLPSPPGSLANSIAAVAGLTIVLSVLILLLFH